MKIFYLLLSLLFIVASNVQAQDFVQGPFTNEMTGTPQVGDFNGDGLEDVLGVEFGFGLPNPLNIFINTSTDSEISFVKKTIPLNFNVAGVPGVGDIDGDGDLDLMVSNLDDLTTDFYLNNGSGNFARMPLSSRPLATNKIIDLNGDGQNDFMYHQYDNNSLHYSYKVRSGFSGGTIFRDEATFEYFDVADLDNDNDLDVVAGFISSSGKQIVVYENQGNAFVELIISADKYPGIDELVLGDINDDGNTDIVFAYEGDCYSLLNQGGFSFEEKALFFPSTSAKSIELGDYNSDGLLDVMVGTTNGMFLAKNLSNESLNFELAQQRIGTTTPYAIANGDFNNDGALDVVVTDGDFWWLQNNLGQVVIANGMTVSICNIPFSDFIDIEETNLKFDQAIVLDAIGRIVHTGPIDNNRLALSALVAGSYIIELYNKQDQSQFTILHAVKI